MFGDVVGWLVGRILRERDAPALSPDYEQEPQLNLTNPRCRRGWLSKDMDCGGTCGRPFFHVDCKTLQSVSLQRLVNVSVMS